MRHQWAAVAILVAFYLQGSRILPAQSAGNQRLFVGPISGLVADPAGQPVAGTEVVLIDVKPDTDPLVLDKTVTNAQGRYEFQVREYQRAPDFGDVAVVVCDAQGRIGGAPIVVRARPVEAKDVNIQLLDVQPYHGRLVDAGGEPIVGAVVTPIRWYETQVLQAKTKIFPFSADMITRCRGKSAEDGGFVLEGMASQGTITAQITAGGFGASYARFTLTKPVTIQLARAGSLRGRLALEGGEGALSGIELQIHSIQETAPGKDDECTLYYSQRTMTDAQGAFHVPAVPARKYAVSMRAGDDVPYMADTETTVEVKPGEETVVSLPVRRAIALRGQVVNKVTGQGIAGVRVCLPEVLPDGSMHMNRFATTDDQGTYTIYVKPGKFTRRLVAVPDGYVQPTAEKQPDPIEVTQDMTWPTIELEQASVVELLVVDKAGTPVAGAEVHIRSLDRDDRSYFGETLFTDSAGKFTINRAALRQKLHLRVRTKTAASDPLNITVGEAPGSIRLVVDDKTSFTLRGIVLDDAGRPVPDAVVQPMVSIWFGNWGIGYPIAAVKTDAGGEFAVGGLWPGDTYDIQIDAAGFAKFGSTRVTGTPGAAHDFGQIRLVATGGVVEGKVVDSAGQGVADVRVFNSGDAPEPIETHSDAAGKFRLEGFRKGPVFVFAQQDGWRFTGLQTRTGVQDAILTILRSGEPVPQRSAPEVLHAVEEEQAARKLLEVLLEKSSSEGNLQQHIRSKLARVDRYFARARGDESPADPNLPVNRDTLKMLAEDDLDEALSLVTKQESQGYYDVEFLANSFAASDPQKAMRCVEEAVVRARSLDQPQRATSLAEMGTLAAQLGNEESGRKLVLEAAAMAAGWTQSDRLNSAVGSIAASMARFDLSRALAMLDNVEKGRRDQYVAEVATSLDDVQLAESLLKDLGPWYAQHVRLSLAYRIAAARPAEAVALIERLPVQRGSGNEEDTRALAFGWLATAIAPRDPALAHALIDRAFAIYLRPGDSSYRFWGPRAAQPALLAVQAQQAGYPDMESIVWRVLATRPTTQQGHSPVAVHESNVMMAMCLALVDRPIARQTLAAIEPYSEALGTGGSGVGRIEWSNAWAVADPSHAVELALRDLDAARDAAAKRTAQYTFMEMVNVWTTPVNERLSLLITRFASTLSPLQEY